MIKRIVTALLLLCLGLPALRAGATNLVYHYNGTTYPSLASAVDAMKSTGGAHTLLELSDIYQDDSGYHYAYVIPKVLATYSEYAYNAIRDCPTMGQPAAFPPADTEFSAIAEINAYFVGCNEIVPRKGWFVPGESVASCGGGTYEPDYDGELEIRNFTDRLICYRDTGTTTLNYRLSRVRTKQCPDHYSLSASYCINNTTDEIIASCDIPGECPVPDKEKNCPTASNPVAVLTGNKILTEVDFVDNTPYPLTVTRYYNSTRPTRNAWLASPVGHHWKLSYDRSVRSSLQGGTLRHATVEHADGRREFFENYGAAGWHSDASVHTTLERLGTGFYDIRWRVTSTADEIAEYRRPSGSARGILTSITAPSGATTTFEYDADLLLRKVTSPTGRTLLYDYDQQLRVAFITLPDGIRKIGYRYDDLGNLEYVDYPDGTIRQYHYNEPEHTSGADLTHALTGITDQNGKRYATYEYYDDGRAKASYHAGDANLVRISYDPVDGTPEIGNARGIRTTYDKTVQHGVTLLSTVAGPGCSTCDQGDTGYIYDPVSNRLAVTDNGLTTRYGEYDEKGNYHCRVKGITRADTTPVDSGVCDFDPQASPLAQRTEFEYDPRYHHRLSVVREPSVLAGAVKTTRYGYDEFGNRTSITIDGFRPDGTPVSRTTSWTYDGPLHQLSSVDGPRTDVSDVTFFDYYPDDPELGNNRARLQATRSASGIVWRSDMQYTATGKLLSETRPNGVNLGYIYYPDSDRLWYAVRNSADGARVDQFTYLATGELDTITHGYGTPDAVRLSLGYDDARRLRTITDALGNRIEYILDTEGNTIAERYLDANGTPGSQADDVVVKKLARVFDDYNRPFGTYAGIDDPAERDFALESRIPRHAPDGTLDMVTDGRSRDTDYGYDDLRRLVNRIENFEGTDPDPASNNVATGYGYDVADRLTEVADPNGNVTAYQYDDLGNLLSTQSPDTGLSVYGHDPAGNITTKTDALGQTFTYDYDSLNRLTRITTPESDDDVELAYDRCAHGTGRLCSVSNGAATVHYDYNAFGELHRHQGVEREYDSTGRVQQMRYPSGATVTYAYDAAGQTVRVDVAIEDTTQSLATDIRYRPFGPIQHLRFGNGLILSQDFDHAYRMTGQTIPQIGLTHAYSSYDANGNLQYRQLDGDELLGYDPLNRLDAAIGPYGPKRYDYDRNGNRTALNGEAYRYEQDPLGNTINNRLEAVGTADVLLDDNGNTLANGYWRYQYTSLNRLKAATESGSVQGTYRYNGLGQRSAKDTNDGSRRFLYGEDGELLVETDPHGLVLVEYIYLNGQLLARHEPDDDGDGVTNLAQHLTHQGPTNLDTDADGLPDADELYRYGTDPRTPDTDGDGHDDAFEVSEQSDPRDPDSVPRGDVNTDGEINLGDFLLLQRILLGLYNPTPAQAAAADLNGDGQLDQGDAILLLRKITGRAQVFLGGLPETLLAWAKNLLVPTVEAAPLPRGRILYYHLDSLGTPVRMTDESGTVVWAGQYAPFGSVTETVSDAENLVRFPGQYFDAEIGLHYNYYRYYDPATGRYLTSDPIGLEGSLNTFLYVNANPIRYTDSKGLFGPLLAIPLIGGGSSTVGSVGTGTLIAIGSLIGLTPWAISNSDDDNVTPFPGTEPKDTTADDTYCPPADPGGDDECQNLLDDMADWFISIMIQMEQGANVSLQIREYNKTAVLVCQACPDICDSIPRFR